MELPDAWEGLILLGFAIILLGLVIIALKAWSIGRGVDQWTNQNDVAIKLQKVGTLASQNLKRVERLDADLLKRERTSDTTASLQTLYGVIVGLWGGLLADWVGNDGALFTAGQLIRGTALTIAFGVGAMTLPPLIRKAIDRTRARLRRDDAIH